MRDDQVDPAAPADSLRRIQPRAGKPVRLRKSKVDRPRDPNEAYQQAEEPANREAEQAASFGDPLHPDALAGMSARPIRR